jgi:hypothetical protein
MMVGQKYSSGCFGKIRGFRSHFLSIVEAAWLTPAWSGTR